MKYTHVIITDDRGKPMAWDDIGKQLCYCTDSTWEDESFPVTTYTVERAALLIKKSEAINKMNNLSDVKYKTMPFHYPAKKRWLFKSKP